MDFLNLKLNSEQKKVYQQERHILEVTEEVAKLMDKKKIDRIELAKRIGKSPRYITSFLRGTAKMDLRIISDIFWALDSEFTLVTQKINWEFK